MESTSSEKNWRNTSLQHADLQGTRFSKTDFTGSTFLHANTYLVDFSDCIWDDAEIDFAHQYEIMADIAVQYLKKNGLDHRTQNFEKFLSRICAARKLESVYGNCTCLAKLLRQWPDNTILFTGMKGFESYMMFERAWTNIEKSHVYQNTTETIRKALMQAKSQIHYSQLVDTTSPDCFLNLLTQHNPNLKDISDRLYISFEYMIGGK